MFKKFSIFISSSCIIAACIFTPSNTDDNFIFPIKSNYYITSKFGYRTLYGKQNFHTGLDVAYSVGTKVYSSSDGKVSYIGFDHDGYGNYIIISYNNFKFLYAHLNDTHNVSLNDTVFKGTLLSSIGPKILPNGKRNGNTTGAHLHFEVRVDNKYMDPLDFISLPK